MKNKTTLLSLLLTLFLMNAGKAQSGGTLDLSFDSDGIWTYDYTNPGLDAVYGIAEQSDGKLVIAGYATDNSNPNSVFMRLNPDGTPDVSFDFDGKLMLDAGLGGPDRLYDLLIQPDGKILAGGYVDMGTHTDVLLIRLTAAGAMDASFGNNGIVKTDFSFGDDEVINAIGLQPDGKIVVAGKQNDGSDGNLFVARYLSNGVVDNSFDTDGFVTFNRNMNQTDQLYGLDIAANGDIYAVGGSNNGTDYQVVLMRLTAAGQPDLSFSSDGFFEANLQIGGDDLLFGCTVLSDGSVIAAGYFEDNGNTNAALVKLTKNGVLDNSFGLSGKLTIDASIGNTDVFRGVEQAPDGSIIAAGYSDQAGSRDYLVAKTDVNGNLDASFNGSGLATFDIDGDLSDNMRSMAVQSDGKVLVGGYSNSKFAIIRVTNELPTALHDDLEPETLTLYPNPTQNSVFISLPQGNQDLNLAIYSLTGQKITDLNIPATSGSTFEFHTQEMGMTPGVYLVKLSDGMRTWTQKLIRN